MLYTADGVATVYAYTFRVDRAEDMSVYLDGVLTPSGWTIDGLGSDNGGNVTFSVAPALNVTITLLREIALEQLVDYQKYDPFPSETHEGALDKLTMIDQQLQEQLGRTLLASPDTPASVDNTLPPYSAGKGIMWHETEERMTNSDDNINGIVSAANASAAAAANSETNALASENKATLWAEEAEDTPVEPGEYSAYHWAQKAAGIAIGIPSGTRIYVYNALQFLPTLVGFKLVNVGDVVLGVASDVINYGASGVPGDISGGWNMGVNVTAAGEHGHEWRNLDGGDFKYNAAGSRIAWNTGGGNTSIPGPVMHVTGGDGFKDSSSLWTSKVADHTHIAYVNDDPNNRIKAAVGFIAERT